MGIQALENTYLFKGMSPALLQEVDSIASERPFQPGDRLIEHGVANEALWILLQGSLVVRDLLPGGLEVDLFNLKTGDLFGEMSFADTLPASASVIAETKGKVLHLPFAEFRIFLTQNPQAHVQVLERLIQTFSKRLRMANQQIGRGFLGSLGLVD